jgi:hypothetical protein
MTVESSRQPRSPFALARGLRTLRHRDAGRVTFSFGSRTDPSQEAAKRPIEVERRSRPSPSARMRPTAAAELASHDRNREPLQRRHQTRVWHRCRASSRMTRDPRVASRCQPADVKSRDDHPLDTHRDERFDDGPARVRRPSPATSLTSEERSITRTFARAVRPVLPPRDFTTRVAVRDQTPRLEARTCCVQLPLNDRRRVPMSATGARMTSRRGCPKAPTTIRIQRPLQRFHQRTVCLDELGAPGR